MLDIHAPHETVHTWRDFLIHIATIVIGLIIAVGLEQTVEFIQHRHSANEARENIHKETSSDIQLLHFNLQQLDKSRQQLESDLDALNSNADILAHLEYSWTLGKEVDAAWQAAKIDGSLALIPPAQIGAASYFYDSNDNLTPTVFAYFADMDTYLKAHPGAPRETWPHSIQGRVFNTVFLDSAWRTAQQSKVLQYMPQSEVQANDILYRNVQRLNSLADEKFDQMYRLRKTFASEQDAAKLSPAELDQATDRVVEMISICLRIVNRQMNMSEAFPDFKMGVRLSPSQGMHWPEIDAKSESGEAFAKLVQEYKRRREADSDNKPKATSEPSESAK